MCLCLRGFVILFYTHLAKLLFSQLPPYFIMTLSVKTILYLKDARNCSVSILTCTCSVGSHKCKTMQCLEWWPLHLIEVLEALISQSDGDTKDWIGGVLIKTCFTVSSEQSQSPAPRQRINLTVSGVSAKFMLHVQISYNGSRITLSFIKTKSWEKGLTFS